MWGGWGARSNVVDIICPPDWDRVNCLAQNLGPAPPPACNSPAAQKVWQTKFEKLDIHKKYILPWSLSHDDNRLISAFLTTEFNGHQILKTFVFLGKFLLRQVTARKKAKAGASTENMVAPSRQSAVLSQLGVSTLRTCWLLLRADHETGSFSALWEL